MRTSIVLALVFVLSACGARDEGASTDSGAAKPSGDAGVVATWRGDGNLLEFSAKGMSCSGCEATIQKRIGALDGVSAVEADKDSCVVKVTLETGADREALESQITQVLESPGEGKTFTIVRPTP